MNTRRSTESMAERIARHDWSSSAVGEKPQWPDRLRTVLDLVMESPQPMLLSWGEEHTVFPNDAALSLFGLDAAEVVGSTAAGLLPGGSPLSDALEYVRAEGVADCLHHRELPSGAEVAVPGADDPAASGSAPRAFDLTLSPVRATGGGVAGVLVTLCEASLRDRLERAEDELAEARQEAAEAGRVKDRFLAALGHELRNPLTPISTALHLMEMRAPDTLPRERRVMERQVDHLKRLLDDLLDVSGFLGGRVQLLEERIDLRDVVRGAVEHASPLLTERRHRLEVDLPDEPLEVDGDEGRLVQVVSNLLINAAQYTDPEGEVAVTAGVEGDRAVVAVSDNGRGIDPELLPHVFDLFVQGRRGLDRSRGGLGLGLGIVHSLVERHGGRVTAESEGEGRGARFVVELPLAAADRSLKRPRSLKLVPPSGGPGVLVVDDNRDAAEMLQELLTLRGYRTVVALDGPAALEQLDEEDFDLCIFDIGLPVMDGYELARRVRDERGDEIGLVALTGYGQPADRERALAAGYDCHLVKPVNPRELLQCLAELTGRKAEAGFG